MMMRKNQTLHLTKQDKERLISVKEFICLHPDQPVTIRQLVQQSGLYRSKLTAAFKQEFQQSIYRFALEVKMKQAKHLLLANDQPVKSIARLCGYKTVQSFSRIFKKYYEVSPSQFQRRK